MKLPHLPLFRGSSSGQSRSLLSGLAPFVAVIAGSFVGCTEPPADGRLNVMLVVLDTTRARDFGCYGGPRGLTPNLDALAAEGTRFERASAHAPWTLPSTASLLTSLPPEQHGAGGWLDLSGLAQGGQPKVNFSALSQEIDTLAEAFQRAGWSTGAVVNVDFLDTPFGLTQGFEHLDASWGDSNTETRSAAVTTDAALEWLDREDGDGPFFCLVHYFDPHAVYAPPPEFRRRFAAREDREDSGLVFGTREHMLMLRAGKLELDEALLSRAKQLYDGELAYLDAELGRLFEGLAERGLAADTLVVVTADHGEEFGEHDGFEHGHTLYDELLHVPLIFRLPGLVSPGGVVEARVGLLDVAPTLCDLAGVAMPVGFQGHSLREALRGEDMADRPLIAHGNFWGPPLSSWISGRWKVVMTPGEDGVPSAALYDLEADGAELHDLALEQPERLEALMSEYELAVKFGEARRRGAEVELSPAERARLEALGYLGAPESSEGP